MYMLRVVNSTSTQMKGDKMEQKYKFNVVPESKLPPFTDHFTSSFCQEIVRSEPGGCVLPFELSKFVNEIIDFQSRKDDTWILTFPKSGRSL